MSLDEIIEKRRSQNLKKGSRNEKIRNRTAIRKRSVQLYEQRKTRQRASERATLSSESKGMELE